MSKEKTKTQPENKERSVFYETKKKFANVFIYAEDMIQLECSEAEVKAMTNGRVNEIVRETLGLSKRVSGKSGYKKDLISQLGLAENATQGEINKAMMEKLKAE